MNDQAAILVQLALLALPWSLRRRMLCRLLGWDIHSRAKIGFSLLLSDCVILEANAKIGSFNVVRTLDLVHLAEYSQVGSFNWVCGARRGAKIFPRAQDRRSELIIGKHSAITSRHYLDCSFSLRIGMFSTIGGVRSTILTHEIDLIQCIQGGKAVSIGDYVFVGTNATILSGVTIPSRCVVAAGAVVTRSSFPELSLIAGVPARVAKALSGSDGYFTRQLGYVD